MTTKTILVNSMDSVSTSTANTTQYLGLYGTSGFSGTEVNRQTLMRTVGTASNLFMILTANTIAATSTLNFRKNAVNGSQTLSIASNTTGSFEDTTHTDSIAAGDKITVQFVPGAATGTVSVTIVSILFQSQSGIATKHAGSACGGDFNPSVTTFLGISSDYSNDTASGETTEANTKFKIDRGGGLFKNASVNITANSITAASTYTFRKNGANTAITASITASTTGFFEDTTHNVSVEAGDTVNHQFITGATGTTINLRSLSIEAEDIISSRYSIMQTAQVYETTHGTIFARNATFYVAAGGGMTSGNATESNMQLKTRAAFSFFSLSCLVIANTNTDASTVQFRVNAANGNNVLSIPGTSTGYFSDSTPHADDTSASDLVCIAITTGVGSGVQTTTVGYFSVVCAEPAPAAATDYYAFV